MGRIAFDKNNFRIFDEDSRHLFSVVTPASQSGFMVSNIYLTNIPDRLTKNCRSFMHLHIVQATK